MEHFASYTQFILTQPLIHTKLMRTSSGLMIKPARILSALTLGLAIAACSSDNPAAPTPAPGFLGGIEGNREIGLVVNSGSKSLTMFQLGSPSTTKQVALGSSSTITLTGYSIRNRKAAVPLGNAASVAIVDLENGGVTRFFTFPDGNTTGSAWANDSTVFAANTNTNKVGRFTLGQSATEITATVNVAPAPTSISFAAGMVLVLSGNLENYQPIGNGIVTAIDPATLGILGTVETGGTNPNKAAVGPDGLLYVVNTGDYVNPGSLAIIDPVSLTRVALIQNISVGPGSISIHENGLAFISSFSDATVVFNTRTRSMVRGTDNPVCARVQSTGACRGASSAALGNDGKLYQTFFGSTSSGLAPYVFVFDASTYALKDSIAVGSGPMSLSIRSY